MVSREWSSREKESVELERDWAVVVIVVLVEGFCVCGSKERMSWAC